MKNFFNDKNVLKQIFTFSISGLIIAVGVLLITNINTVLDGIGTLLGILAPFIWGFVFAFLVVRFAGWIEKRISDKIVFKTKRLISSILSILLLITIFVVVVLIVSPQIADSIVKLTKTISSFDYNTFSWLTKNENIKYIFENLYKDSNISITNIIGAISSKLPNILNYTKDTVKGLFNFVIGFIIAFYILIERENIINGSKKILKAILSKKHFDRITYLYRVTVDNLYNYFEGAILDSIILGIICFICMTILGLDYAVLISFTVTVTNIIPFFGPFIGGIPSGLILLMVDPKQALIFAILILVLQQVDGNIVAPRILGKSVGLSSLWVVFAILVGGGIFGFPGMLLGVPVFSVIYTIISDKINNKNKVNPIKISINK